MTWTGAHDALDVIGALVGLTIMTIIMVIGLVLTAADHLRTRRRAREAHRRVDVWLDSRSQPRAPRGGRP